MIIGITSSRKAHPAAMKFLRRKRLFIWLAAIIAVAGLTGCLSTNESFSDTAGANPRRLEFDGIKTGQSKDFILGLLGEPKEKITEDDGGELWRWPYLDRNTATNGFIFLYLNSNQTTVEKNRYVEFKNGIVAKTWSE